jgi:putative FmdB family regulatory protein
MPIYRYVCKNPECENDFEITQGMNEKKLKKCPKCMKRQLERLPSVSSVHFKGDGFSKSSR